MRSAAVVVGFAEAELAAMRLDGDVFEVAGAAVPVDQPADDRARAAALADRVAHGDLVVVGRSAAWVHGAAPLLERPVDLAVDLTRSRRLRRPGGTVREMRLGPDDTLRLHGVRVTTPLRTAFDLLRRDPVDESAVLALLAATPLPPPAVPAAFARLPATANKRVAIARVRALLDSDRVCPS